VCMYTMTPDEHFLIGPHRDLPGLVVAGGFSGHGYKFASAVGAALADLAVDDHTALPVDMFDPHRPIWPLGPTAHMRRWHRGTIRPTRYGTFRVRRIVSTTPGASTVTSPPEKDPHAPPFFPDRTRHGSFLRYRTCRVHRSGRTWLSRTRYEPQTRIRERPGTG